MARISSKNVKELVKQLSQDKALKDAIDQLKSSTNSETAYSAKSITDFLTHFLRISLTFAGKKKAKAYLEIAESVAFLISLSILLKKNLFDRPEVQAFFKEKWSALQKYSASILSLSSEYVNKALSKIKKKKKPTASS